VTSSSADPASSADPPPPFFVIRTIAVIGAGTAGRSFALACAAAGFNVVLEDVMPANLRRAQEDYADMGSQSSQSQPGKLKVALAVEDAVRAADLAIDFVPDELESKLEIFSMIDRMAPPRTILCTPSEALSITDLASCTYRPTRCFALRGSFATPASTSPLRVLYPQDAAEEALQAVREFLRTLAAEVHTEPDPNPPQLGKNYR
jgi:3-hydroxybutyryl-CoA dehydrogenase